MTVLWTPPPEYTNPKCKVCGNNIVSIEKGDTLEMNMLGDLKGTWHCGNGHENKA
jgi:hypothetical protein